MESSMIASPPLVQSADILNFESARSARLPSTPLGQTYYKPAPSIGNDPLFGGGTGSGKSGGLNVLLGNLTACTDVVIWAIDLKRGMELGPWTACLDRLAATSAKASALLADAVAILEGRAEHLAA